MENTPSLCWLSRRSFSSLRLVLLCSSSHAPCIFSHVCSDPIVFLLSRLQFISCVPFLNLALCIRSRPLQLAPLVMCLAFSVSYAQIQQAFFFLLWNPLVPSLSLLSLCASESSLDLSFSYATGLALYFLYSPLVLSLFLTLALCIRFQVTSPAAYEALLSSSLQPPVTEQEATTLENVSLPLCLQLGQCEMITRAHSLRTRHAQLTQELSAH